MRIFLSFVLMSLWSPGLLAEPLVAGIEQVAPDPGSTDVSPDTTITLSLTEPASFAYTNHSPIQVIDVDSGLPVFSIDPDAGDPQEGQMQYSVHLPPGTLLAGKQYGVDVARTFSRMNVEPWVTAALGADQWIFTTAAASSQPLSAPVGGFTGFYPAPNATNVPLDTALVLELIDAADFQYTDSRYLTIVEALTQNIVYQVNPEPGHALDGQSSLSVVLPAGVLQPFTTYQIRLDPSFARINQPPWQTGPVTGALWQFTTGPGVAASLPIAVAGFAQVYPAPGAEGVSTNTTLDLYFEHAVSFAFTEQSALSLREAGTADVLYSVDPVAGNAAEGGQLVRLELPPNTLQPNTSYEVSVDYQFARFNAEPWRSSAIDPGVWMFSTGAPIPVAPNPPVNGVSGVYPATGQSNVDPATEIVVQFTDRAQYGYTTGSLLSLVDTRTNTVVASVDPEYQDSQEESFRFVWSPQYVLEQGVTYEVTMDHGFARFDAVPWQSGGLSDGSWLFTVAGEAPANNGGEVETGAGEGGGQDAPTGGTDSGPGDEPVPGDNPVVPPVTPDPGQPDPYLITGNGSIVTVTDANSVGVLPSIPPEYGIPDNYVCAHEGNGTLYHVGPGQAYENLGDVPWRGLMAGDTVMIEWRSEPYREKIGIEAQGTATNPVRVCGVRGPQGQQPVLSGDNATTSAQFSDFYSYWQVNGQTYNDESLAVIYIKTSRAHPWGYKPQYIEIANLRIEGANPNNAYLSSQGVVEQYYNGASAIRGNLVENLTVRATEITDNGNGFFILSKGEEEEVSRNILFEKNYVHNNGVVDDYLEHNIYTQAENAIFQYNVIDNPRPGMQGSTFKSRGTGTVIRYNWIEAGMRLLDLVDPEDSWQVVGRAVDTYVYGNVLINDFNRLPSSSNMIHFGGDTGWTNNYRQNLYFYNNTVVTLAGSRSNSWRITYLDLPTAEQTVYAANNIFDRFGDADVYMMRGPEGNLVMDGVNWINSGWEFAENSEYRPFHGTVTLNGTVLESGGTCLSAPYVYDFSLQPLSSCIDAGMVMPRPLQFEADREYVEHMQSGMRAVDGFLDLGAFER